MKAEILEIFWKFWNLKFLKFWKFWNYELTFKKKIILEFWNFLKILEMLKYFEIFEVLKFVVQWKKGSKVSSIVCRAIVSWRLLTRQ